MPTTGRTFTITSAAPFDYTRFNRLLGELQEWRSDDHEDNKVLCRSHIIELIEGVRALQREAHGFRGSDGQSE